MNLTNREAEQTVASPTGEMAAVIELLTAAVREAMERPLLLRVEEAAALLGMKKSTFYQAVSAGRVPGPVDMPGAVQRWKRSDLEKCVERMKTRR